MEAVVEKKKQSYVFDRKLTDEEIEELIENYDYDPKYLDPDYDDGGTELEPVWDRFGNPTEATIRARYEARHDIGTGPMTLDEFDAWLDELRAEEGLV
ncbi:MAG: hypothetical protein IJJ91_00455 [Synergistaceae bacterium]|nr:hypothetical protein [Synergistaceae bacterium]MBQ6417124.1 hypothetical protein [Synergistaceae bacterium]MBQ6665100.1 hypothetical protein [Synergistaceae bacterium]MBR0186907.1 hypothetical protein [Synergistaceae bacterium]MBR0248616.1 hypothetical protein [Synergistaceae bacterium]